MAESDKGVTDYSLSFEGDVITDAKRRGLLGESPGRRGAYNSVSALNPPKVGFGFIRKLLTGGRESYEAYWLHKVQFSLDGETARTREGAVDWRTLRLSGTGIAAYLDSSDTAYFYDHTETDSLEDARSWLILRACPTWRQIYWDDPYISAPELHMDGDTLDLSMYDLRVDADGLLTQGYVEEL